MDDAEKGDLEDRIQAMHDCVEAIKETVDRFQHHARILEHGPELRDLIQRQNDLLLEMNKGIERAESQL